MVDPIFFVEEIIIKGRLVGQVEGGPFGDSINGYERLNYHPLVIILIIIRYRGRDSFSLSLEGCGRVLILPVIEIYSGSQSSFHCNFSNISIGGLTEEDDDKQGRQAISFHEFSRHKS
jgi:hypothetical protein